MEYPTAIIDKQYINYKAIFDMRLRERLRALLTPNLIEEHRRNPWGAHSDALQRVLNYYRRDAPGGSVAILQPDPCDARFQLLEFVGSPDQYVIIDPEVHTCLSEAVHAVFLRHTANLVKN